ncbi:MAG: ZIP family metal transporter [Firmicutes bacterium]|nr:ZIP family metal transporter [Bacillota bacterium]
MALLATLGTWFVTALGAATVVFFKSPSPRALNLMLGFSSGVMIAASFWSLLQPAIERAEAARGMPAYFVAVSGFLLGAVFLWGSDKAVSFARRRAGGGMPGERMNRIIMLVLSITLHNIPEGLAVGVAFGALGSGGSPEALMGAVSVAVGIGLQNFPEGAAVSVPLRREGYSRRRSFLMGQASGLVEPISGVIGALLVVSVEEILPYALSFAAGAMILVAVHELIPECQSNQKEQPYSATMGIILGFAVMMLLDVMLG